MSAKKNTLLNYFTRKTSSDASGDAESKSKSITNLDDEDEKKKREKGGSSKRSSSQESKQKNKLKIKKSPKEKNSLTFSSPYEVGDLVWAKLQGYPWWPSLVCEHPTGRQFCKWDGNGNCQEFHVQFLDVPPSRAWIKEKCVKLFKLNDSSINKPADPKWHRSLKEAERAFQLAPKDRLSMVFSDNFMAGGDANSSMANEEDKSEEEEDVEEELKSVKRANSEERMSTGKRRRIASDCESSGDEYKPKDMDDESESVSSCVSEKSIAEIESDIESPPAKKKKTLEINGLKKELKCSSPVTVSSPRLSEKTKLALSSFVLNDSFTKLDEAETKVEKEWSHLALEFLKPEKIRDLNKRQPSHPDYDPKTLYIPDSFKNTLTPAMKQWWEVKCQHFDTILFFKLGKFYELYHMDAVIGVNVLNLIFMKGESAHSGFPEIAYGRYAASLVERGYKVARVEQTETPVMMEERCKKLSRPSKYDKVVKRELCQITSKGTQRYGILDAQSSEVNASYLLAVTEECCEEKAGCESEYGVCFIDTSLGVFHIGQFRDDRHCSRFRTLVSHYPPVQVLYERRSLSAKSLQILNSCVNPMLIEGLLPKSQFWDSTQTLRFLTEGSFFKERDSSNVEWPVTLKNFLSDDDSLGLTAKKECNMAVKSLGAIIWYLKESHLETELLSMKNFETYICIDIAPIPKGPNKWSYFNGRKNMILDGVTLKNLDVLQNSGTGTIEGSLISKLDHCSTLAGKRLLHTWVCAPLVQPSTINDRLDAIEDLMNFKKEAAKAITLLKKLPDLERLLKKIHTMGHSIYNKDHPDQRAIFYEDVTYSKRKIMDFISVIEGFKLANQIVGIFSDLELKSHLLKQWITHDEKGGKFPNLTSLLEFLENSFDQDKAKKDGTIIPSPGVDKEYDSSFEEIKTTTKDLDSYLETQCKLFGCKVVYVGTARNRYQIEVPDRSVSKATNKHELQGQRKGFKRYWTSEVKDMLQRMISAEEKRDSALRVVMSKIFILFSEDSVKWDLAVTCLANFDVLLSLTHYSQNTESSMCRPSITIPSSGDRPFLKIVNGRHPCITGVFGGGEFIPNNTTIGSPDPGDLCNLIMITGPNMGGKSTLLRQVGLIVVIAQLGCYVPAEECLFTPVDRIFTRLGANDRIMMGESTFFVELSETAATLRHSTEFSLILFDELGRGTSTYDGMAIAYSVVSYFSNKIACRTLFSTHYHHLVQNVIHNPRCQLGHMACLVENENVEDPTQETITFLYKLIPGACPKSYGFNAAKLAGMPEDVIRVAHRKAKELEEVTTNNQMFRNVFSKTFSKDCLLKWNSSK